jgi:hypothetical protein
MAESARMKERGGKKKEIEGYVKEGGAFLARGLMVYSFPSLHSIFFIVP